MPIYKFSIRSHADLEYIVAYTLDNRGAEQANRYIDGLEQRVQTLADAPSLGKPYNDLSQGMRGFLYQSHINYYVEADHGITVVRVLH